MAVGEMNVPATQQWGKESYLRHSSGGKNDTQEQWSSFQQLRFHLGIVLIPIITDYIVAAAALLITHPLFFLFVKFACSELCFNCHLLIFSSNTSFQT